MWIRYLHITDLIVYIHNLNEKIFKLNNWIYEIPSLSIKNKLLCKKYTPLNPAYIYTHTLTLCLPQTRENQLMTTSQRKWSFKKLLYLIFLYALKCFMAELNVSYFELMITSIERRH